MNKQKNDWGTSRIVTHVATTHANSLWASPRPLSVSISAGVSSKSYTSRSSLAYSTALVGSVPVPVATTMSLWSAQRRQTCAAVFECQAVSQHDAGDHVVFIAEVTRCTSGGPRAPLLYHASRFHTGLSASP